LHFKLETAPDYVAFARRAMEQRWLQVLKAGGTKKPLELMQMAGIDLHTPQPIHDAVAFVGRLVDELERSFR
jgi:oligoendopeptidase F